MLINQTYKNLGLLLLSTLILIALNISLSKTFFRVDLSSDKLHSISNNTKELLRSLDTSNYTLYAEVYLEGNFPAEIEKLKLGLNEKLTEFKAYAGDNFKFNFINLDEDQELSKKWKDELIESGIYNSEILIKRDNKEEKIEIWPAIKLRMGEQTLPIQLLQPGRFPISQEIINIFNDQIEYNFVKALLKLNGKPALKYLIDRLITLFKKEQIIIATSNENHDNEIEEFSMKNNLKCYRGSLKNVSKRFMEAAKILNKKYSIRITQS